MRRILVPTLLVLAATLVGCSSDDAPASAPDDCTRITDGAFTMVAENLRWNVDCLVVARGTTITFTIDNRDRSVGHNFALSGPSGSAKTDIEQGPTTQTLTYEASAAGRHPFECEPHANMMKGNLYVE